MAKRDVGRQRPDGPEYRTVDAVLFDKRGGVLREWPGFVIGADSVGHGLSMSMGAAVFVDPKSGELVRKWDPWGVLAVTNDERVGGGR